MKTPIEFDYDLWTTEEGKCMVRVKLTGEVCEVSRETMRVLRNEEKKLRRSKTGVPIAGCKDEDKTATLLSLDFVSMQEAEEMSPAWLEDPNDLEETVLTSVMEQEFRLLLSERQLEVYLYCLLGGIEQMCEILSISTKTGYRILREGKILSLKVGRAYRIPKAHLFTYLCIGCGETVNA